jgi:CubicO group peptidase (beta-lactamase class C family)
LLRRRIGFLLIIGFVLSLSCHKNPTGYEAYESYPWQAAVPEDHGLDPDALNQAIRETRNMHFLKSLLIVKDSYLVLERYFDDEWQQDDGCDVRSVTKSFVSALIGIALREHHLESLDQKMLDFFPEYVHDGLDARKSDITIGQLITMTAGYDGDENYLGFDNAGNHLQQIIELPLRADPGETFCYSNYGANLLTHILSRATGMDIRLYAHRYLCDPIGITISRWIEDPQGMPYGGYGMHLTPRNMARFGYLYLRNGFLDGKQVVPSQWIQESTRSHSEADYGYLWWLSEFNGNALYMAAGYSGQYIVVIPGFDMVIVTTSRIGKNPQEGTSQQREVWYFITHFVLPAVRQE